MNKLFSNLPASAIDSCMEHVYWTIYVSSSDQQKKMEKVNVSDKFQQINDYWNPRIAGTLNGQHVKLVKLKGEFIWHQHEMEDEMFLVIRGELLVQFRDHETHLKTGEFIIIPRGIEHKPVAKEEVHVMLFEPATTLNTGNQQHKLTKTSLDTI